MDKFAQRRSMLNKLKEKTNISGHAAEKFFNPEFQKVMVALRLKDDYIRSIVAGEKIGDGDFGQDSAGFKQLLKSCKSNLNRREYMSAISDLGRFHAKLAEVELQIQQLDSSVNEVHHEFLFKDLDDEKRDHLNRLKQRLASQKAELVKQAGIMDFFHNIGTTRGRALAAWEKRYPKKTADLKKQTASMLDKSEALNATTLSSLKEMASARANRNVDNYMTSASKITKLSQAYDKSFRAYYDGNVKEFMKFIESSSVAPMAKTDSKGPGASPDAASPDSGPLSGGGPGHEATPPSSYGDPPVSGKNGPASDPLSGGLGHEPTPAYSYGDPASSSHTPFDLINKKGPLGDSPSHAPLTDSISHPPSHHSSIPSGGGSGVVIQRDSGANGIEATMPSPGVIPKSPRVPDDLTIHRQAPAPGPSMNGIINQYPRVHNPGIPMNDNGDQAITMRGVAPPAPAPTPAPVAQDSGVQPIGNKSDQIAKEYGWAHKSFYETLEAMSGESPAILGVFISKYAKKIESTDLDTSIKLLKIAKNIKG